MYTTLCRLPFALPTLLAVLAMVPLACSELGVDPAEAEDAAAVPAASPEEGSAALPFNTGLNEAQQQSLFSVLAGVTDRDQLDPSEREAMVQALTDSRARAVAIHDRQVASIQASELAPEAKAERVQQQAAFRDFALSFFDKALAALS